MSKDDTPPASRSPAITSRLGAVLRLPWVGPLIALLCTYGLFSVLAPDTFAAGLNLETMLLQTVVVGLCAIGMTLVMIKGGIDLSVGSVVALSTVVIARALEDGHSPYAAAGIGILVGIAAGLINGSIVAAFRITPFIVTLGTMSIMRGAAKGFADEKMIHADPQGIDELMGVLPEEWSFMLLAPGVWLTLLVGAIAAAMLTMTRLGRHMIAIGSNELTARLCGISVPRVTVITYGIAGLIAGLAGVMEFATLTVGDPTDSIGLELKVIAAVVIGGGSLSGGQGSVSGALLGAFLMTVIQTGCTHVGVPNWVQEILTGIIIVTAVGLDRIRPRP